MELKDVFEYMGFEKEPETIDEFKELIKTNWTLKKEATKDEAIRNEVIGSTFKLKGQNIRKKLNENYGLEIPNSELESKQLEDFVIDNIEKIKSSYEAKLQDFEKKVTEPNEALKEFETKALNLEKRLKEERDAKKLIESEYNQFKEAKQNELKNYKIDVHKKDVFSNIKFSSDVVSTKMGQMALKGYHKDMDDKYIIDFDDEGNEIILDRKKGERIPNEKVAGKYKTPKEVFEEEAILANLVATNEHSAKPIEKKTTFVDSVGSEQKQPFANKVYFNGPPQ